MSARRRTNGCRYSEFLFPARLIENKKLLKSTLYGDYNYIYGEDL